MAKILKPSLDRPTRVVALDSPGVGGAYHEYEVIPSEKYLENKSDCFAEIKFQKGPVKEEGLNGCQIEDLIDIAIHRLECFQAGGFPCPENEVSLKYFRAGLEALNQRTLDRQKRGVEGLTKK